jgi:hypothetical protein
MAMKATTDRGIEILNMFAPLKINNELMPDTKLGTYILTRMVLNALTDKQTPLLHNVITNSLTKSP